MEWVGWLVLYIVPGVIFTEIAMDLAEKLGAVTPETHPGSVRVGAYIVHLMFWPIFVLTAFWRPFKKDN